MTRGLFRPRTLGLLALLATLGVGERLAADALRERAQARPPSSPPPPSTVDPKWPALPPQWTLGQVTGVAVDASDHVWVLHRPWSLTDDEKAQNPEAACCTAAPPVLEFTAEGQYLRGWGGPGAGYEWPEDEHAIHVDHKRNVWITSAGGPRLAGGKENQILKFTSDGKFLLQIGRRGMSQGSLDTANVNNAADSAGRPGDQRALRRRRLRQPPGHRLRRRHRRLQADVGRLRQAARRRRAAHRQLRRPAAGAVHPGARHPRVARRQGLRRRSAQQPHAGVHDRGRVRARDLRRAHDEAARHGVLGRLLTGPRTAACSTSPMPATAGCTSSTGRR